MHEYFEIADNCLIRIITEKHEMMQDAFSSLGSIVDELEFSVSHIRKLRANSKEMERILKNSIMKLLILKRKKQRRLKMMRILSELKRLKDGMQEMKEYFGKDEIASALEVYQKLTALFEGNINRIKLLK